MSTDFEQTQLPTRYASASCPLLTFHCIFNLSLSFLPCVIKMATSTFQCCCCENNSVYWHAWMISGTYITLCGYHLFPFTNVFVKVSLLFAMKHQYVLCVQCIKGNCSCSFFFLHFNIWKGSSETFSTSVTKPTGVF